MLISNYQWLKGQRTLLQCHTQYSSQVSSFYSPHFSLSTLFWQQLGVFSFISKIFLHLGFSPVQPLSAREEWPLASGTKLDTSSCDSWKIIFMALWGKYLFLRELFNVAKLFFHCNTESLLSSRLFVTLCKGKHITIPGMMIDQRLEIAQSSFWWYSGVFSTTAVFLKGKYDIVSRILPALSTSLRVYCTFGTYIFGLSFPRWPQLFTLCASACWCWCITSTPSLSFSWRMVEAKPEPPSLPQKRGFLV